MIGNLVHDNFGHHGNGLTAYVGCKNILFEGNTVMRSNFALTMQDGDGMTVRDNILLGNGNEKPIIVVASYRANLPNVTYENNVIMDAKTSFHIGEDNFVNYKIKGNVLDGLYVWSNHKPEDMIIEGNIITKKTEANNGGRDTDYAKNNVFETDLSKIFIDAANGDFRRVKNGPLMEAGLLDGGRKIDLNPGPWKR